MIFSPIWKRKVVKFVFIRISYILILHNVSKYRKELTGWYQQGQEGIGHK